MRMNEIEEIVEKGKYFYGHFLNAVNADGADRYESNENSNYGKEKAGMSPKNKIIIALVVLIILVIAGFVIYNKFFKNKEKNKGDKENKEEKKEDTNQTNQTTQTQ
jgi:flagellar basal body-associated protein FliL